LLFHKTPADIAKVSEWPINAKYYSTYENEAGPFTSGLEIYVFLLFKKKIHPYIFN